jgi:hypothetical protein
VDRARHVDCLDLIGSLPFGATWNEAMPIGIFGLIVEEMAELKLHYPAGWKGGADMAATAGLE